MKSCAAKVPIFRDLPTAELAQLHAVMQHRSLPRAAIVARHGTCVEHLVIVAQGELKLLRATAAGREHVIRVLTAGDFFGEMALFTPIKLEGDLVVASAQASICLIPRAGVQELLHSQPKLALALVEALAERLYGAEQLIAELGLADVGQRLAAALLRYAEKTPAATIELPIAWAELALRLGTTPETLSRRLKTMGEQGLIKQTGPRLFIILDAQRLQEMAEI